ncbi:MAG TPA: hypothetical protein VIA62_26010 [Thermoanaerobaculia bacterium]|jgi:hypothetical protein|nr:hypothetical protein [Thermoanaerobaculia bacterium]
MKTEDEALHEAAMELAQQAFSNLDKPGARELFQGAMEKERRAADIWAETSGLEPTRSILYRSAASLAWNCQDYPEVKRLAMEGLAGAPPSRIAGELKELLEMVGRKDPSLVSSEALNGTRRRRSAGRT